MTKIFPNIIYQGVLVVYKQRTGIVSNTTGNISRKKALWSSLLRCCSCRVTHVCVSEQGAQTRGTRFLLLSCLFMGMLLKWWDVQPYFCAQSTSLQNPVIAISTAQAHLLLHTEVLEKMREFAIGAVNLFLIHWRLNTDLFGTQLWNGMKVITVIVKLSYSFSSHGKLLQSKWLFYEVIRLQQKACPGSLKKVPTFCLSH